jgi:site-specific DNA-methyltransferase (adenine-specific)
MVRVRRDAAPAGWRRVRPYYTEAGLAIYHGDCREVLPSVVADVVVTDPPYGHGGTPKRGGATAGSLDYSMGTGGVSLSWDVADDSWLDLWAGPAALFMSAARCFEVAAKMRADGMLVYAKTNPHPNGSSFEPCLTRGFGVGARHVSAYNAANGQLHPTQKPLDVMTFVVGRAPAGVILDPFMGSGTTLRAAKDLGRQAIGIEIEERYCEIAADRLRQSVLFGANA